MMGDENSLMPNVSSLRRRAIELPTRPRHSLDPSSSLCVKLTSVFVSKMNSNPSAMVFKHDSTMGQVDRHNINRFNRRMKSLTN